MVIGARLRGDDADRNPLPSVLNAFRPDSTISSILTGS